MGMKLACAFVMALLAAVPAQAQSWGRGGAYTGAAPGAKYYPGTGTHWCQWSAATVCKAWRAAGPNYSMR
jgi:hypothetical protein